jgi:hypothetical protein
MLMVPRAVGVFDGKGNAFPLFVDAENHKLPGLLPASNARGFDDEPFDARCDELGVDDLEQGRSVIKG